MKIESADNYIFASLTSDELASFELTYDELDYSNEKARTVLREILDRASRDTGKTLNKSKHLQIEVIPDSLGGCLIVFSESACGSDNKAAVFSAESVDAFLDLARAMERFDCCEYESALYAFNGLYYLCVSGFSEKSLSAFTEYAKLCHDELMFDRIKEAGTCLIEEKALKILGGAAS